MRLELLLVVALMVLCEPVMPNSRFRTVFVFDCFHVGSVVEMRRIRGAVTVPGWGWAPWVGPLGVGGHGCLFPGWPLNCFKEHCINKSQVRQKRKLI